MCSSSGQSRWTEKRKILTRQEDVDQQVGLREVSACYSVRTRLPPWLTERGRGTYTTPALEEDTERLRGSARVTGEDAE
jgi:hypothetical protein